jgi:hypothetical protein
MVFRVYQDHFKHTKALVHSMPQDFMPDVKHFTEVALISSHNMPVKLVSARLLLPVDVGRTRSALARPVEPNRLNKGE